MRVAAASRVYAHLDGVVVTWEVWPCVAPPPICALVKHCTHSTSLPGGWSNHACFPALFLKTAVLLMAATPVPVAPPGSNRAVASCTHTAPPLGAAFFSKSVYLKLTAAPVVTATAPPPQVKARRLWSGYSVTLRL